MEGLVYLQKYGIGGPEFGIKEEFVPEYGRQLFHARAMNREACCLQLGQLTGADWNRVLHTGNETTAPQDRTKTQHQRTIDWTKNILIFSIQNLQRPFHQQSD